ncbi:hypothetical protein DSL64_26795 [Dyadobacter luteus]|uniref:Uncharacterized protein n=1 Tax=Dyadobacter luteus TaxID=2259619 RepID=A0A3D8Y3C9_9BACT|nr:hypothetical protein [Dyadobacter luteus]REA56528.1 hypothetical protein DSL64_26795 [Dyadobacter luteus]
MDINGDVVTVPSTASTLLTGSFVAGDISSAASGARAVSGFITGATVTGGIDGVGGNMFITVAVTFPSIGTSNYTVSLTQTGGPNLNGLLINGNAFISSPLVLNKTATGFTVYLLEYKGIGQSAAYDVILVK